MKNIKANRITGRIAAGIIIQFWFTFLLIVPSLVSLFVAGKIVLSAISLLGAVILYNGVAELYDENNLKTIKKLKTLSIIGMTLYAVVFVTWTSVMLSNTDLEGEILRIFSYGTREAVESYVWLHRIRDLYVLLLIIFNLLISVYIFKGLIAASVCDKQAKKKFRILEIINLFAYLVSAYLTTQIQDYSSISYAPYYVILIAYMIWLILCITNMREYIKVSDKTNNGSIFNRIPEDEYQEFLEKMK